MVAPPPAARTSTLPVRGRVLRERQVTNCDVEASFVPVRMTRSGSPLGALGSMYSCSETATSKMCMMPRSVLCGKMTACTFLVTSSSAGRVPNTRNVPVEYEPLPELRPPTVTSVAPPAAGLLPQSATSTRTFCVEPSLYSTTAVPTEGPLVARPRNERLPAVTPPISMRWPAGIQLSGSPGWVSGHVNPRPLM